MSNDVRVRFAPSPTGYLHVGGARTMLFNWLFAKRNNGTMILRIEDTDEKRNTPEALQAIYDGLNWLQLTSDEGPDKGGKFGPYRQSERNAFYEKHLGVLEKAGKVYKEDDGAVRFKLPRQPVTVNDLVCGTVTLDQSHEPDMTIRRPDGSWIFHFVSVVDDLEMNVTHVIRGEDHLSNTPKHIELYKALGAEPPQFAHIPLILNPDGRKMSKRDQGASVADYMAKGYTPEAVVNYLCLLGWSPGQNREIVPIDEMISLFDLKDVNRRNAAFDINKCYWMTGQYVAEMSLDRFMELSMPFIESAAIKVDDAKYLRAVLEIVKEKIKLFSDVPEWISYFFTDEFEITDDAKTKVLAVDGAKDRLSALKESFADLKTWTAADLESELKGLAAKLGCKAAALVHPARVAASGRTVGPSLYHMLEVMGRDRVLARFEKCLAAF
jgi:glutamyl-tRNA synthetase